MTTVPINDLRDYVRIFRRRRAVMLGIAGLVSAVGVLVAFALPPAYRSTATILIEEQEVPVDLVRSTITSYADQRIQTIKHQVMTRPNLWKIVEQYALYEGLRRRAATEDVLERLVGDIRVEVISAEVVDRRTNQPTKATIAFTLSYDGETPVLSQQVANELTSLFLSENLKSRERHAQETTAFLKQEAGHLGEYIEGIEQQIAAFKQDATGALPELMQLNMQLRNQTDHELMEIQQQIRSLEDRKSYLEGQLVSIKPHTPIITASGERILDSSERLKALRAQYVSSSAYLSPDHPDVLKMKQEIDALEAATGERADRTELEKRRLDEHTKVEALLQRLGDEHPDVQRGRQVVAALNEQIQDLERHPHAPPITTPENPAYITIQAQLRSVTSELKALKRSEIDTKARAQRYAGRVERTPEIEPRYMDLTRDRDNSVQKYHEIRSRLLEAQVAEGLETQRKGERFSLIDPPDLPEKPDKPNRPAIVFVGVVLALASGVGVGMAAESLDRSVRGLERVAALTGQSPLAAIPFLVDRHEAGRRTRLRRTRWMLGAGLLVVGLVLLHITWMPLDVLWFSLMRRFGLN